jgi:hypothetical protein
MSLFSTFALGAAQGAAQGFVQGTMGRIQAEMEEAKAKIQAAREQNILRLQQDFTTQRDRENRDFTASRDDARYAQQKELEDIKTSRHQADIELRERIANARDERERELAEKRHQQTLAAVSARENKSRGIYDTTADGEKVYIEGTTAKRVSFDDGKPVKTLKNMTESDKMELRSIDTEISTLTKNAPISAKERPAHEAKIQALQRRKAELTGRSSAMSPTATTDDFLSSVLGSAR